MSGGTCILTPANIKLGVLVMSATPCIMVCPTLSHAPHSQSDGGPSPIRLHTLSLSCVCASIEVPHVSPRLLTSEVWSGLRRSRTGSDAQLRVWCVHRRVKRAAIAMRVLRAFDEACEADRGRNTHCVCQSLLLPGFSASMIQCGHNSACIPLGQCSLQ